MLNRRRFVERCAVGVAAGTIGRRLSRSPAPLGLSKRMPNVTPDALHAHELRAAFVDPVLVRRLAMRAIDVAHSAGAAYADVRLTRTINQSAGGVLGLDFIDRETVGVSVRALVKGAWGFAATSAWTDDEVVRIANAAVAQATVNATGVTQPIELAPAPVVTGSWMTPIREDPFLIPWEVKLNLIEGVTESARQQLPPRLKSGGVPSIPQLLAIACIRQERALATTDGTFTMQSIYQTGGGLGLTVQIGRTRIGNASATGLETSGRGFEIFADAKLLDQLPRMIDEADADAVVPVRPLEVGQYDVVCDAATVANLLDETFGRATELDRALGYEANAGGTSYLGPDPMTWLGQPVASPLMTITADRTHPTGVATVKWDDDGVAAEEFPLVQGGQLVDYQTTREHAPHLSAWYGTRHQVVRSHGCAASQDAQSVTLSMIPNLTIAPNASGPAFLDMVAGLPKGVAIAGAHANADFQAKNGMLWRGTFYDVKNGKRVAKLTNNAGVLFSALELWKHVTALGGPASAASMAMSEYKGEPGQTTTHTINSVAVAFKQQAVVDLRRKA